MPINTVAPFRIVRSEGKQPGMATDHPATPPSNQDLLATLLAPKAAPAPISIYVADGAQVTIVLQHSSPAAGRDAMLKATS
jgi:hypothetical protein